MALQVRDKNGNFVPKTTTNIVRHHIRTKRYALPIIALIVIVGAIVVFKSFASDGVYSYTKCAPYYTDYCVGHSAEATVATMFQGVIGRPIDQEGLKYWSKKVLSGGTVNSYSSMVSGLMASKEFNRRHGAETNSEFVASIYPQIAQREVDPQGKEYWTKKLDTKTKTRKDLVLSLLLTKSFIDRETPAGLAVVRKVYNVKAADPGSPIGLEVIKVYTADQIGCTGKLAINATTGRKECSVVVDPTADINATTALGSFIMPSVPAGSEYDVCLEGSVDSRYTSRSGVIGVGGRLSPYSIKQGCDITDRTASGYISNGVGSVNGNGSTSKPSSRITVNAMYFNNATVQRIVVRKKVRNADPKVWGGLKIYTNSEGFKTGYRTYIGSKYYFQKDLQICDQGKTCTFKIQIDLSPGTYYFDSAFSPAPYGDDNPVSRLNLGKYTINNKVINVTDRKQLDDGKILARSTTDDWYDRIVESKGQPFKVNCSTAFTERIFDSACANMDTTVNFTITQPTTIEFQSTIQVDKESEAIVLESPVTVKAH